MSSKLLFFFLTWSSVPKVETLNFGVVYKKVHFRLSMFPIIVSFRCGALGNSSVSLNCKTGDISEYLILSER